MLNRLHIDNVKKVSTWLDKLTFQRILILWLAIVLLFGFVYFYFSGSESSLVNMRDKSVVSGIGDSIYFSFVTATTTGFGDIIPVGKFKFIAIMEVVFGLLLLAIVTSKLVSIKQDSILTEIYDISFHEKINRVRSSLLLFRQNVGNIINSIEEGILKKKFVSDTEVFLISLEGILKETSILIGSNRSNHFIKKMNDIDSELIFNSIILSFEKFQELIGLFDQNSINWKNESLLFQLNKCFNQGDILFEDLKSSKIVGTNYLNDIMLRKKRLWQVLKSD